MSLPQLPSVTRLSDRVVRILGQNPGKFTLQGTNTYLVGKRPPWILIDTGEGRPEYISLLEQAIAQESTGESSTSLISDIIITHRHVDHHGGLASVLPSLAERSSEQTSYVPPRLHKYPLGDLTAAQLFARKSTGLVDKSLDETAEALASIPQLYTAPPSGSTQAPYYHDLQDRQTIQTEDGSTTLKILHTPGHTGDSITILLEEEQALFTGDSVLGHGTAVFEDLNLYISSLKRVQAEFNQDTEEGTKPNVKIYPGHGSVVEDGLAVISEYILHRHEREQQIVAVLKDQTSELKLDSGGWTVEGVVRTVYASYPPSLWPAAGHGVTLHLLKLEAEGRAQRSGDKDPHLDAWQHVE